MKTFTGTLFLSFLVLPITPLTAGLYDLETKLTPSGVAAGYQFGISVAIDEGTAIVGAVNGSDGSTVLIDAATGNELFNLVASDAAVFGSSVGISGNTAIVGAGSNDDMGENSGSAYLFDVATGNELFKLTASDAAADDYFGDAVSISGNTAIAGAFRNDDDGNRSGSAYLFDVTTGNELFKLTASDAAAEDFFGNSVDISGNIAIVGANGNDDAGPFSGSAYLFDVSTGNELFKLTASDASSSTDFGAHVAISGNIAIVGATFEGGTGAAYLFDVTTGNELFKLTASDGAIFDLFGTSVGIDGNIAIVGAVNDDAATGSAYLFDVTTGNELIKLTASDGASGDQYGYQVSISDNVAIVGAHLNNNDAGSEAGAAYLYTSIPEPTTFVLATLGLVGLACRRYRRT